MCASFKSETLADNILQINQKFHHAVMKAIMCDGMEPVHIDKASTQINLNLSLGALTNYDDKILSITDNLSNPCVYLPMNCFTKIWENLHTVDISSTTYLLQGIPA